MPYETRIIMMIGEVNGMMLNQIAIVLPGLAKT